MSNAKVRHRRNRRRRFSKPKPVFSVVLDIKQTHPFPATGHVHVTASPDGRLQYRIVDLKPTP